MKDNVVGFPEGAIVENKKLDRRGGGGDDSDMNTRVSKLEDNMRDIKDILKRLEPAIFKLTVDMSEVKGKMSHMPTLFQIGGIMLAINAGIVAVAGLIINILKT